MKLLEQQQLPAGFAYPGALRRLVARELTWFEPWWVLDAPLARELMMGLAERYRRTLIPFAKREDCDDVAVFDPESPGKVIVLHDFATDAWERRREYDDFYAWLRSAVEAMIEYDSYEEE